MHKHITFKGRVQGVGFRYTTQGLANILELRGWVRNLPNGDVEAIIQGDEATIVELIDCLRGKFAANIHDVIIQDVLAEEYYKKFTVRFE